RPRHAGNCISLPDGPASVHRNREAGDGLRVAARTVRGREGRAAQEEAEVVDAAHDVVDVRGVEVDRGLRLRHVTRVVDEPESIDRDAREVGGRCRTIDASRPRELPEDPIHRGHPHRRERGMVLRGNPLIVGDQGWTGRVPSRIRARQANGETHGGRCQSDDHEYDENRTRPFHTKSPPSRTGIQCGSQSDPRPVAFPFSAVATPFIVTLRNRRWYFANCAWDAVAFHAMLNEEIRIGSQCHHCAESISITLANGRATASPRETRVYLSLPATQW